MNNIFSEEQQKQIIQMYNEGVHIEDIMSAMNSEERYVREVLKAFKIDRGRGMYQKLSEELKDRIVDLYCNHGHVTQKKIAFDVLVSDPTIRKVLRARNIPMRTPSENNKHLKRNSHYFDLIDTTNKAYILGLIYADGNNYIGEHKTAFTISLQECDRQILDRIKDELCYEGKLLFIPLKEKNPKHQNQYRLTVCDEHISHQLLRLGVTNNKSLNLNFPTFLRPDLIRHFVRGIFDGDGNVYYDKKRDKWQASIVGTLEIVTAISNILTAMFVKNHIFHPKQSGDHNTYIVRTAANQSTYKFLSWLYQDCDMKLERKYNYYLYLCEKYLKSSDV